VNNLAVSSENRSETEKLTSWYESQKSNNTETDIKLSLSARAKMMSVEQVSSSVMYIVNMDNAGLLNTIEGSIDESLKRMKQMA
jgi:hypothetical protein